MPVNTPQPEVAELIPCWEKIDDTLSPRKVKAKGPVYLPKLQSHEKKAALYDAYLSRALLVPVLARAKRAFEGLAFRTPPVVTGVDKAAERDITGAGVTLRAFARQVFGAVIAPGRVGILADMAPVSDGVPGAGRAFLSSYGAPHILEAREEVIEDVALRMPVGDLVAELGIGEGDRVTTRVRLCEPVEVPKPNDPFTSIRIEQIRVISLEAVEGPGGTTAGQVHQLWREKTTETGEPIKDQWIPFGDPIPATRRGVPVPFIPFVIANQEACGAGVEEPALLGFAEINLSQYRTSADLENARFKMGHPQLCVWGAESDKALEIGDGVWTSSNAQAHAEVLQVADQFGGLERAIAEKDEQMLAEGARLMAKREGEADTATAARIKAVGERSLLMAMTETTSEALSLALAYQAWWTAGTGTLASWRERVSCRLNTQFDDYFISATDAQAWLQTQIGGGISKRTLRALYRRGGMYEEGWDDNKEAAAIEMDQAAGMADLGDGDGNDPTDTPPGVTQ